MKSHPLFTHTIIAMLCITTLALAALFKGIDGYLFFLAITAIAGIAGYQFKALRK